MAASPQPGFLTQILQQILSQPSNGPQAGPPAGPMAPQQQGPQPGAGPVDPVAQFKDMLAKTTAQGQQAAMQAHQAGILKGLLAGFTAKQPANPANPKRSQQTIADTAAPLVKLFAGLMGKVTQ